jgi:hypothetical protein
MLGSDHLLLSSIGLNGAKPQWQCDLWEPRAPGPSDLRSAYSISQVRRAIRSHPTLGLACRLASDRERTLARWGAVPCTCAYDTDCNVANHIIHKQAFTKEEHTSTLDHISMKDQTDVTKFHIYSC